MQIPERDKKHFFHNFKFHLLHTSGGWMRIYTYKQLYKPDKVITSLWKRKNEISILWQWFLLMLFKSDKFFDLKSEKTTLVKLVIQKIDITENICDHTVNFFFFFCFFCMLQVKANTFWDLTTSSLWIYDGIRLLPSWSCHK